MTATAVHSPGVLSSEGIPDMVYDTMVQIACGCNAVIGHREGGASGYGFVPCRSEHSPALDVARRAALARLQEAFEDNPNVILIPIMQAMEDTLAEHGQL